MQSLLNIHSSNWRDSDGPFLHQINGRSVPIVELPKDSIFDDTAYDFYTDSEPERYELKSPNEMYEIWREEFDYLADEGRMINFVLHPQFIGRASRIQMLSRLIGYMKTHGAWLDTNKAVASYLLETYGYSMIEANNENNKKQDTAGADALPIGHSETWHPKR